MCDFLKRNKFRCYPTDRAYGSTDSVSDQRSGIPNEIKDKIFQPFFTTWPTGQGTGLGLSLSYDIVKVHGGNIMVNSVEDQGSMFIVSLPIS